MAKDKTNLNPETVSVKRQKSTLDMTLPGDGKVQAACGRRPNTSAAHYADGMSRVIGGAASAAKEIARGE